MTGPIQTSPQQDVRLTLFVTGQTPRSQNAVANLKQFCDRFLPERYATPLLCDGSPMSMPRPTDGSPS